MDNNGKFARLQRANIVDQGSLHSHNSRSFIGQMSRSVNVHQRLPGVTDDIAAGHLVGAHGAGKRRFVMSRSSQYAAILGSVASSPGEGGSLRQSAASPLRPGQCQPPIVPAKPLAAAVAVRYMTLARTGTNGAPHDTQCRCLSRVALAWATSRSSLALSWHLREQQRTSVPRRLGQLGWR
jgi:hypothetical protein